MFCAQKMHYENPRNSESAISEPRSGEGSLYCINKPCNRAGQFLSHNEDKHSRSNKDVVIQKEYRSNIEGTPGNSKKSLQHRGSHFHSPMLSRSLHGFGCHVHLFPYRQAQNPDETRVAKYSTQTFYAHLRLFNLHPPCFASANTAEITFIHKERFSWKGYVHS